MESRTVNTGKNAIMQVIATSLTIILGLVSRYFFNVILGEDYLGLSSLFTTILGVLSFADLGISNSFTYCLYRPIAEGDNNYIEILLYYFKKAMLIIMAVILIFGIVVAPFLRRLAPGSEIIDDFHLYIYYSLSLCEVLAGYFCTYQVCYVAAKQQEYRIIPLRMFFGALISVSKIVVLIISHNYTFFVITGTLLTVVQQLSIRAYIRNKYSIVKTVRKGELRPEDKSSLKRNTASMVVAKFATISVYQTDSLIISVALKIGTLGRITNYTTIKSYAFSIISQIQTAAYASMGNVIVTENKEYQLHVFYKYLMVTQILVSFAGCMLTSLMTPFIVLLFGEKWQVDEMSIVLMVFASVVVYHTYAANILPTTYGRIDIIAKYVFVEGIVNLVASIVAINIFGLVGVYIGTVVAETIYFIVEPRAIFKALFDGDKSFYSRSIKGMLQVLIVMISIYCFKSYVYTNNVLNFIVLILLTILIWVVTFLLFWHNDMYFKEIVNLFRKTLERAVRKRKGCENG